MTIITILYLMLAIREIRKAQQTVDIDQVILGIELIKVSKLKSSQYYRHASIASLLFCSPKSVAWCYVLRFKALLDQSYAEVSSVKFARLLVAHKNLHLCKFSLLYNFCRRATFTYIGVLSAFLLFIVIDGFLSASKIGATCDSDSWIYDSISVVDSI